ncbi:hypothetical protein BV25DRAFT_1916316 [Artomyces pyxidatus]|uniref:Uncharacterized protein n=1 Tax=Artomyces pyxidatus TaxID=48021 RepID=A0ACB8SZM1_9AGAM|nr:hypothetical protein BV25DRAFT_1916316 [Artomyces pyxidatus]
MPPAGLTSDNGALLVGVVIANIRFHDAIEVKLWVYGTWLLNTATTCIYTKVAYTYYINHFNDPLYQIFEDNCVAVASIMTGSTVFLVQSFFIMRVWKLLERSWYTVALITFFIVLALYALSSSAAITYLTVKRTDRAMVLDALLRSNVVVETALDIFLTVSLVYTLQKHPLNRANRFDRLMVFLATRGILMTAYQAVVIILTNVITLTFVTAAFQIMLATVYTSSMLFTVRVKAEQPKIRISRF